jgi:hypothetical protein
VGATKETTVDDLPVRLPSARLVVPAHGGVLLSHSFDGDDGDDGPPASFAR